MYAKMARDVIRGITLALSHTTHTYVYEFAFCVCVVDYASIPVSM